jgi:hypothetical protein
MSNKKGAAFAAPFFVIVICPELAWQSDGSSFLIRIRTQWLTDRRSMVFDR